MEAKSYDYTEYYFKGLEEELLKTAIEDAEFVNHPLYSDVFVAEINKNLLPVEILEYIKDNGFELTQAGIVIAKRIPLHKHKDDGEIYYYGEGNAEVTVYSKNEQLEERMTLHKKNFSITQKGQMHTLECKEKDKHGNTVPTTFLYAKFK